MRDLSRASGMSLAGLYYYFESKERLLFLIQKHTFTTIVQRLKLRLEAVDDPEQQDPALHTQPPGLFSGQSRGDEGPFA